MFKPAAFEPAPVEEIETVLTDAMRSSAGGQMTRNAEMFLGGVRAGHLTERLMLAGFLFMRRADWQATHMAAANASTRGQDMRS